MGSIDRRPLKGYVRYDGSKRLVAGSLILRRKMPKVGNWVEVPAYKCCSPTDINCVEYSIVVGDETISLWYTDCDGSINGPYEITGPTEDTFCCRRATVAVTGSPVVTEIGLCENSTTSTTTSNPD